MSYQSSQNWITNIFFKSPQNQTKKGKKKIKANNTHTHTHQNLKVDYLTGE